MRYDLQNGLYTGQIIYSIPYLNIYQVRVIGYDSIPAVGMTIGSDQRTGHRGGPNYPPGAHVLVMIPNDLNADGAEVEFPCVIIGSVTPYPLADIEDGNPEQYGPNVMQQNSPVNVNNNKIYPYLQRTADEPFLTQDRSYNRFMDLVPGDFNITTPLGGTIHLGDFMSRIGASASANISCYALQDVVEIVAQEFGIDTDTYTWQKYLRGDKFLIIEGMSLNTLEACGGFPTVPAFTEEISTEADTEGEVSLVPVEDNQTPFLREQNFRGSDVDGEWKSTMAPKDSTVVNTLDSEHIGLYSEQRRVDGILRVNAAKEIAIRKTPTIRIAEPRLDYATTDRDPNADLPPEVPPWEELGLSEDEYRAVYNIVSEAGNEIEDLTIFAKGIRQDAASGIWLLETNEEIRTKVFEDGELPTIPDIDQDDVEYPPDTAPSIDVEVTPDRIVKIFKNSSAFIMEDDGDIVLGDGYGAEIRMQKGNIILSSAADIIAQPGRDFKAKVPGNTIINSGKRVEISSTTDSVAVKAEKNFHTVSGNGGEGSTILENKSTNETPSGITDEQLLQGQAIGSGIILNTKAQIAQYANSIYMGGRDAGSPSKTGTVGSCDIVINAGNKGILTHSQSLTMVANSSIALSMINQVSGFFLQGSQMAITTPSEVNIAAPFVGIDQVGSGQVKIPKIIRTDVGNRNQKTLGTGNTQLAIQGTLAVRDDIGTTGNVISSGAGSFKQGANPEPIPEALFIDPFIPASAAQSISGLISGAYSNGLSVANAFVDNYGTLPTYAQQVMQMAFPKTDSDIYHASKYFIRNSMWQDMLDGSETWQEKSVKHDIVDETFPYPGKDAHQKSDAYIVTNRDGTQEKQKLETYKVNTKGLS
jgi:hypothetical protein